MEREVSLRDATRKDIESILAVQRASPEAGAWPPSDYARALGDAGVICLLADDSRGERVVGFLVARAVADEMEILNLAVGMDYRRRGIGRRLLGEALARAHARGARKCWLEVRASNQAARDFYRALGFSEGGRRPRYYRAPEEDAIVCVCSLPAASLP